MDPLKKIENELKKCVKCGACRAHCPVFTQLGREPASARGKVALARAILAGSVGLDARTRRDMSNCLLCGRCVDKCANDVPTDLIVLATREASARSGGLTPFSRVAGFLLRNRGVLAAGAPLAALLRPFLFRKVPASSGLRLRFPFPFLGRKRIVPPISVRPFLTRYPEVIEGKADAPRVAFFAGCMTNFIYPGIGEAAVALLRSLGCTIVIPRGQQCCGFPAVSGGDMATFRLLAERNLCQLEACRADYVMTACASCGGAFHRLYPEVLGTRFPELADRCRSLAEKTVDATVLLGKLGFSHNPSASGPDLRVTYHDPCHLCSRGIRRQPRDLLRSTPGVRLVEMEGADSCCGLGGTFSVYHYRTSLGINARKIAAIREAAADEVATACPGCMMQLSDGLAQGGVRTRVVHLLEILARSITGTQE